MEALAGVIGKLTENEDLSKLLADKNDFNMELIKALWKRAARSA